VETVEMHGEKSVRYVALWKWLLDEHTGFSS
jgi:hypothetical protein